MEKNFKNNGVIRQNIVKSKKIYIFIKAAVWYNKRTAEIILWRATNDFYKLSEMYNVQKCEEVA